MKKFFSMLLVCIMPFFLQAQTYVITTIAGTGVSGYSGDGGPALSAQIVAGPMTCDTFGNLFFGDLTHHIIRKIGSSGVISTFAGTGVAGFSGDTGLATANMINTPTSLAADKQGNVYVADDDALCIHKIDPSGTISRIVGNGNRDFDLAPINGSLANAIPLK